MVAQPPDAVASSIMPDLSLRVASAGVLVLTLATLGTVSIAAQTPPPAVKARPVRAAVALPKMDGANLKVHTLEVTYPPGATSAAHRHPCPVIGYVLSGTIRMQVSDQPVAEYKAGDTFVEMPTDVHRLGANPSADTPAVFLVTFVCDKDTPLSVPEHAAK
jgi:quercetin dioxygenase-like cupin family protein